MSQLVFIYMRIYLKGNNILLFIEFEKKIYFEFYVISSRRNHIDSISSLFALRDMLNAKKCKALRFKL